MWVFSVFIPLGVIHSIVIGKISVPGDGASRILRFDENPVGFVIMIGTFCVLEFCARRYFDAYPTGRSA